MKRRRNGRGACTRACAKPKSAENPKGFDYENWIHVLPGNTLTMSAAARWSSPRITSPRKLGHTTTVYSKELNALFLADFGYNKVHLWMGDDIDNERIATGGRSSCESNHSTLRAIRQCIPGTGIRRT